MRQTCNQEFIVTVKVRRWNYNKGDKATSRQWRKSRMFDQYNSSKWCHRKNFLKITAKKVHQSENVHFAFKKVYIGHHRDANWTGWQKLDERQCQECHNPSDDRDHSQGSLRGMWTDCVRGRNDSQFSRFAINSDVVHFKESIVIIGGTAKDPILVANAGTRLIEGIRVSSIV